MDFRYQEMVYKPDHFNFHIDDRTEWLPNGIFNYNVSRMIKDLEELEADPEAAALSWHNVLKEDVSVKEAISANFGLGTPAFADGGVQESGTV